MKNDDALIAAAVVGLALMNRVNTETSQISGTFNSMQERVEDGIGDVIGDFQALTGVGVKHYVNVNPETFTQPSTGSQWYQVNMTPEQLTERWTAPSDYQGISGPISSGLQDVRAWAGVPVSGVVQQDNYLYAVI